MWASSPVSNTEYGKLEIVKLAGDDRHILAKLVMAEIQQVSLAQEPAQASYLRRLRNLLDQLTS